ELLIAQPRNVSDPPWLVGDVRLVEVRGPGRGDVAQAPAVLRGGLGIAGRPRGQRSLAMRVVRVVVEEERLRAGSPRLEQLIDLGVEDVIDVVLRLTWVVAELAVLVEVERVTLLLGF